VVNPTVTVRKADDEKQIVYGEVYAPGVPDSQGDVMTAEEIEKTAYGFMEAMRLTKIDTNHDLQDNGSYVVESFIARKGDPTFIEGSWVIGLKVPDKKLWKMVKSGELNGFSFDGEGYGTEKKVTVDLPEKLNGVTQEAEDHVHTFVVKFDATGQFLGGETDTVDGHKHKIVKGTATEQAMGHRHRFSFVEGIGYEG
jgi:hypothetical protein